jgi:SH3-like domain-containing protein
MAAIFRQKVIRCAAAGAAAIAVLLLLTGGAGAADDNAVPKLPRFVSLHADKVNLRTGPGRQYPIEWVLTRKEMPVEVTAEFEHWRRVREWDGTEGWVQQHMIDGKRFVIVEQGAHRPLRAAPDPTAAVVARAEPGVIARLLNCQGEWCRVEAGGRSGWMKRADLWGVYPGENPQ